MSPRPGNRQRATLSKQSLDCQTESRPTGVSPTATGLFVVTLSVAVSGSPDGLRVKGFTQTLNEFDAPGVLIGPNQIEFDQGAFLDGVFACWVDASATRLRTSSNGRISPQPLFFP